MADYVTSEELQAELEELAEGLGISVQELLANYVKKSDLETELNSIKLDIQKITEVGELDGDSLAEKIISINKALEDINGDDIKELIEKLGNVEKIVAANTQDIADHKKATDEALETQANKISNAETKLANAEKAIADNKAAQAEINKGLQEATAATASAVETLNGDAETKGSIAKQVKDAVKAEQDRTNALVKGVADRTTAVETVASEAKEIAETMQAKIEDATDADGNLVEGLETIAKNAAKAVSDETAARIKDVEELKEAIQNAGGSGLTKGVICGAKAANKFRAVFDLSPFEECSSDSGDEA